jgi:hypothetical protein
MQNNQHQQLNEGLRANDLKEFVSEFFSIDQYKSKMGEDQDVAVLNFKVKEKHPAMDLVEFIETGYGFVLDADMSSGEEHDGQYQVFVEIQRTEKLPQQVNELLRGIGKLTDVREWEFSYQKQKSKHKFDEETLKTHVPVTPSDYRNKIVEFKNNDLKEFFDQGAVDISLDEENNIVFSKPYSGNLEAKFLSIGDYDNVKNTVPGGLSLDESSQSQVLFLTKFLGNYDINKIESKFLIRNGNKAVVLEKNKW